MAVVNGDSGFTQLTKLNVLVELLLDGRFVLADTVEIVRSADQLIGDLSSSKLYVIDGEIDFTGVGDNTTVPSGGLSMQGYGSDLSFIKCSDDNFTLFESADGGNVFFNGFSIEVNGSSSAVFDLTSATGNEAVEMYAVNYNNCTSLGEIINYRQMLEDNTGRFGGTPELTFSGSWDGARITTSIVRDIDDITSLFKTGTSLTFSGRFITDINCDMPTNGAFIDFSESNIVNDESLIIDGAYVSRDGVLDASDTTLYPNINHQSVKSNWNNNTGLPNTRKYIKASITTEAATTISEENYYYQIAGTFTTGNAVQFDMPTNGVFELLTGNGVYQMIGTLSIAGTTGDTVDLRVTKSTDGGSTFPTEINHISHEIPNFAGTTDFAVYTLNFISELKKGDMVRIEVENKTGTNNVTAMEESFFIIAEI